MESGDIAAAVERGITSQAELITSLSLAVIGGLLAYLLQVRIHNATHPSNLIDLRRFNYFVLALVGAGIAIALGYVVAGILIQISPQLFSHTFDVAKSFSAQEFSPAPTGLLQLISLVQFLVFLGAVLAGVVFIMSNRR
jgi:hypothetical protein